MPDRISGAHYEIDIRQDPFDGEPMDFLFPTSAQHRQLRVLRSRPGTIYRKQSSATVWKKAQTEIDRFEAQIDVLLAPGGLTVPDHSYIGDANTHTLWTETTYIHGQDLRDIKHNSKLQPSRAQLGAFVNGIVTYYEAVPDGEWFLDDLAYRQWRFGAATEDPTAEDAELHFHDLDLRVKPVSFFQRYDTDRDMIQDDAAIMFKSISANFGLVFPDAMERMAKAVGRLEAMRAQP